MSLTQGPLIVNGAGHRTKDVRADRALGTIKFAALELGHIDLCLCPGHYSSVGLSHMLNPLASFLCTSVPRLLRDTRVRERTRIGLCTDGKRCLV